MQIVNWFLFQLHVPTKSLLGILNCNIELIFYSNMKCNFIPLWNDKSFKCIPVNVSVHGFIPASLFDVPKSEIFNTPLYVLISTLSPWSREHLGLLFLQWLIMLNMLHLKWIFKCIMIIIKELWRCVFPRFVIFWWSFISTSCSCIIERIQVCPQGFCSRPPPAQSLQTHRYQDHFWNI